MPSCPPDARSDDRSGYESNGDQGKQREKAKYDCRADHDDRNDAEQQVDQWVATLNALLDGELLHLPFLVLSDDLLIKIIDYQLITLLF
jgi:hypothetical protein